MRTTSLSYGLRLAAAVVVLLGVLTAAPPAAAHTDLAAATPQPGAVVTRLDTIRLEFHGPLRHADQHAIRLLGPEGGLWDDAQTRMVSDRALLVGVVPSLARQGEYTVRWCALTLDGHRQSGAYVFSYAGPTSLSTRPRTTADGSAACVAATGGESVVFSWLIAGVIVALVLFVVTAAIVNRR